MSIFHHPVEVDVHDVDFNGIARMSSVMRYIQSAAQAQLSSNGMTYETLYGMKRAFILSRIKIELDAPVKAYEKLVASTFPCESRGYSFLRCYSLQKGDVRIARAASVWALVDVESRSLVRVNDFELGLALHEPLELSIDRFRLPSELTEVGTYTVGYGVTDQNKHMNNTAYPDIYSTYLPLDGAMIRSITVNYANEAPYGDVLRVFRAKVNDRYYFRTVRSDGAVNSEAELGIVPI